MISKNLAPEAKLTYFRTGKNAVCDQPFNRNENLATVRFATVAKKGVTSHLPLHKKLYKKQHYYKYTNNYKLLLIHAKSKMLASFPFLKNGMIPDSNVPAFFIKSPCKQSECRIFLLLFVFVGT